MNLFILLIFVLSHPFASSNLRSACNAAAAVDPKCKSHSSSTCKVTTGIESTCKSITEGDPSMSYEYCITALNSNPRAKLEDLHGLAAIATKMAITHAESTESRIDDLLELEHDRSIESKYHECLDFLNDAGDLLKDASDSISVKQYAKARNLLLGSRGAVDKCSRVFSGVDRRPMMSLDHHYQRLAELSAGILGMIHY